MEKVMTKRCKRCGTFVNNYKKYCEICAPDVEKERNRERNRRYRGYHGDKRVKQWNEEHPEERRLHARNYVHRHKEEHKARLKAWRKKNPDKWKEQNKRAKRKIKARKAHALYHWGIRKEVTIPGRIVNCKDCGKEVASQKGQRNYRKYCDECVKKRQINARIEYNKKFKKKHPDYGITWRQRWVEKVTACTCGVCGELIIYKGHGRIPCLCELCKMRRKANQNKKYREKYYKIAKMDTIEFIKYERRRTGLNKIKRWTKPEIDHLFAHYYPLK